MSCFDKAVWVGDKCQWNTFTWLSVWLLSCAGICVMLPNANDWLRHNWLCVCARVHGLLIIEGWKPESFRASWIWSFLDWNFGNGSRLRRKKKLLSAVRLVGGGTSSFSLVDDLLWTRDTLFLIQWVPSTPGRVEVRGRSWARLLLSQH